MGREEVLARAPCQTATDHDPHSVSGGRSPVSAETHVGRALHRQGHLSAGVLGRLHTFSLLMLDAIARRVAVKELDRGLNLLHQIFGHALRQIVLHDHPEHGCLDRFVLEDWHDLLCERVVHGHSVATDVPMPLRDDVLEIDLVVAKTELGIEHGCHHRQAMLLGALPNSVHDGEKTLPIAHHGLKAISNIFRDSKLVVDLALVASSA
mmetsp:Transcript_78709/g.205268  ORF Transcript_78709/g.205268 Transcript_78709/m.205268 type:complete len:208 (+) Transcript_78709:183-806(+)